MNVVPFPFAESALSIESVDRLVPSDGKEFSCFRLSHDFVGGDDFECTPSDINVALNALQVFQSF